MLRDYEAGTNVSVRIDRAVIAGTANDGGIAEKSRTRNVFQPPIRRMVILRLFAESEKRELYIGVAGVKSR